MAYDNKNKYPRKTTKPKSYPIERKVSNVPSTEDKDTGGVKICLDALKACKEDMSKLNGERERLYRSYKGETDLKTIEGRSKLVSTDVSNAIESFMPDMMEVFYGGQNVVEIRPQGMGDEPKSRLMQEKINFDFQKGLNGYKILHDWFKDALIHKMGVVKWYWKETKKYENIEFEDLTVEQMISLQNNEDYEITEIEEETVVPAQMGMDSIGMPFMTNAVMSYDCKGKKITEISKPVVENVPPEEFIFDITMKSRDDGFIAHRKSKKRKDVIKDYGLTEESMTEHVDQMNDPLYIARFDDLGGINFLTPDKTSNEFYVYECYHPAYENKIITIMGDKKIREEENTYGCPPFVVLSPLIEPHRMIGRGIAELTENYQNVHTALTRYIMDNIAFQSNGMNVVNPYRINVDDLLNNNKPGGVVRTKFDIEPGSAIFPVPVTPLAPQVFQFREMSEGMKENAIGITRYNQGLDAKSLNRTATGISQIMSAAQKRVRFIARTFAETGVKQLFEDMVNLNLKFFDGSTSVKINEEWKVISSSDISGNFDVLIDVGVGTGSTEVKVNQMMQMLQNYGMIANIAGPMTQQIFTIENIKNIIKEIWQAWGYKDTSKFVSSEEGYGAGIPPQVAGAGQQGNGVPSPFGASNLAGVLPQGGGELQEPSMGLPF